MHYYAGSHKQWLRERTDSAIAAGLPIFISESAGMKLPAMALLMKLNGMPG
jgi:endoglucanase